jgi:hypothetical protein
MPATLLIVLGAPQVFRALSPSARAWLLTLEPETAISFVAHMHEGAAPPVPDLAFAGPLFTHRPS